MQNKGLKHRFTELEENLEEAQNTIKEFEKQKNYNNLIPNLMQEIQELRQASGKANNEKQELQNHFSQL